MLSPVVSVSVPESHTRALRLFARVLCAAASLRGGGRGRDLPIAVA